MKIIPVIAAVILLTASAQAQANPSISSSSSEKIWGSSYQQKGGARVNPDYPEELFILETYNIGQTVYGTLWNNTEYAIRDINVIAYVGIDSSNEYSQTYTHSGLLAPGVKISVPVRVRSAPASNALRASRMEIRNFTVRQ